MTPTNIVTVGPSPRRMLGQLVLAMAEVIGGVTVALLGLSLAFGGLNALLGLSLAFGGLNWFLSSGWVIVPVIAALVGCCFGALFLAACIGSKPRVEIGPDGFVARHVFGSRSRRWSDIEGDFVVIKVHLGKGVGYHLTQGSKESAGIKPTTLFAGNDEAILGVYCMSIGELAELLNQHKGHAAVVS